MARVGTAWAIQSDLAKTKTKIDLIYLGKVSWYDYLQVLSLIKCLISQDTWRILLVPFLFHDLLVSEISITIIAFQGCGVMAQSVGCSRSWNYLNHSARSNSYSHCLAILANPVYKRWTYHSSPNTQAQIPCTHLKLGIVTCVSNPPAGDGQSF